MECQVHRQQTMNSKVPITKDPVVLVPDPFWVTSSFSTGELNGKHVRIEWAREGKVLDWGIYRIEMGSYGHSRHIQSIHAVLVEGTGGGMVEFDFDQADADLLHRSNENPKKYGLVARLDCDRLREQNSHLETLVRERRMRKTGMWRGQTTGGPLSLRS